MGHGLAACEEREENHRGMEKESKSISLEKHKTLLLIQLVLHATVREWFHDGDRLDAG